MKDISKYTYQIFFDLQFEDDLNVEDEANRSEQKEFIEEFGKLDLFLANCLTSPKSEQRAHAAGDTGTQFFSHHEIKSLVKKLKKESHRARSQDSLSEKNDDSPKRIESGTILADRYKVTGYIAKGGFGDVYKGYHEQLGIDIAIKVLRKSETFNTQLKERFFREAKVMATINHPNVVRIYDVGEFGGYVYLIMDFVEGVDLESFIKEKKAISPSKQVSIMTQISDALAAIHAQGIIHRDIKPGNIMVNDSGKPILMDFGLAKERLPEVSDHEKLTIEGALLGTPLYMAPEQFKTPDKVTKASDVYSLGVTFYQLATGTNPFAGDSFLEVYEKHKNVTPAGANKVSKKVPLRISRIIDKMLQKTPTSRFPDGVELTKAFKKVGTYTISAVAKVMVLIAVLGLIAILLIKSAVAPLEPEKGRINVDSPRSSTTSPAEPQHLEWASQPRIYTVIPFGKKELDDSYFSDIITDYLSQSNFDIVERERVDDIIEELNLNQSDYAAPTTAVKVGKLVGAHIIVTGNINTYKDRDEVSVRAFNVETSEILGASKIDPANPETAIANLLDKVKERLIYRSTISTLDDDSVGLKHGRLHGAYVGMKLRVFGVDDHTTGVLEVTEAVRDKASAKIQMKEADLKVGMRVEEVKQEREDNE